MKPLIFILQLWPERQLWWEVTQRPTYTTHTHTHTSFWCSGLVRITSKLDCLEIRIICCWHSLNTKIHTELNAHLLSRTHTRHSHGEEKLTLNNP